MPGFVLSFGHRELGCIGAESAGSLVGLATWTVATLHCKCCLRGQREVITACGGSMPGAGGISHRLRADLRDGFPKGGDA